MTAVHATWRSQGTHDHPVSMPSRASERRIIWMGQGAVWHRARRRAGRHHGRFAQRLPICSIHALSHAPGVLSRTATCGRRRLLSAAYRGDFVGYWFMKELQIGLTVATLRLWCWRSASGRLRLLHLQPAAGAPCAGRTDRRALEHSILKSACHDLHRDHAGGRGRDLVVLRAEISGRHGQAAAFMFIINLVWR